MQMLVYENYNKFISATETIKRMKSNVEAMDEDLETVKLKMEKITQISANIDFSLKDKRIKVDKLVRVKRLLGKLEFLSELPEKLVELIDHGQYKRAVQLYRRTISVLTKHSHLLSFKNIKERTERMMTDLRSKVLLLLDDTSLETVKLTHYAAILRLMEAPRDKVLEKLLQAHRTKALRVMAEYYNYSQSNCASPTSGPPVHAPSPHKSFSSLSSDFLGSVTNARKFHQTVLVGLVEACKGLGELFQPVSITDHPNEHQFHELTRQESTQKKGMKNVPVPEETQSPLSDNERHLVLKERTAACEKLQQMVDEICPQYKELMLNSLSHFFGQFNAHVQLYQQLEDDATSGNVDALNLSDDNAAELDNATNVHDTEEDDTSGVSQAEMHRRLVDNGTKSLTKALRTAQLKLFDFEEEKQSWHLLTRQMILDWDFFDTSLHACYPNDSDWASLTSLTTAAGVPSAHTPRSPRDNHTPHAKDFAESLMEVLEKQVRFQFDLSSLQLVHELVQRAQDIAGLTNILQEAQYVGASRSDDSSVNSRNSRGNNSVGNMTQSSHYGSGGGDGASSHSVKALIQRKSNEVNALSDQILMSFSTHFAKVCSESKAVIDVYMAAATSSKSVMRLKTDGEFLGGDLLWHFIHRVCRLLEFLCQVHNISSYLPLHSLGHQNASSNVRSSRNSSVSVMSNVDRSGTTDFEEGYIYNSVTENDLQKPWLSDLPSNTMFPSLHRRSGVDNKVKATVLNSPVAGTRSRLSVDTSLQQSTSSKDISVFNANTILQSLWKSIMSDYNHNIDRTTEGVVGLHNLIGLAVYSFLKKHSSKVVTRLIDELTAQELFPTRNQNVVLERCKLRLEMSSRNILVRFTELNSMYSASIFGSSLLSSVSVTAATQEDNEVFVNEAALTVAVVLDYITIACCILLSEPLPQSKPSSHSFDNRNTTLNNRGAPSKKSTGVQMDIERMFSQRIKSFDPALICTGSTDSLVGTILKVVLKSALDVSRTTNYDTVAYRRGHASISFLKQVNNVTTIVTPLY